jgi:hypothetical protein
LPLGLPSISLHVLLEIIERLRTNAHINTIVFSCTNPAPQTSTPGEARLLHQHLRRRILLLLLLFSAQPFAAYAQFNYVTNDGTITITGYTGPCDAVTIPAIVDGLPVASIGDFAFEFASCVTNFVIPDSVTSIGTKVFYACTNLATVMLSPALTNIGSYAFEECQNLTAVFAQGQAPSLGSWVFLDGAKATIYYLPGTGSWSSLFGGCPAVLWNPKLQASGANFGVRTNRFGFDITGTKNIPIVVEASTNLLIPSWVSLQSCTLTNGLLYFSDPNWANYATRYYRIRSP